MDMLHLPSVTLKKQSGTLAPDPRKMRYIIAEDPEWSLEIIPTLSQICLQVIVDNFAEYPIYEELLPKHRKTLLEQISTDIPLHITAPLIQDDAFWKRCCTARWSVCDFKAFGSSWKRMLFERHLEQLLENIIPGETDLMQVEEVLVLAPDLIRRLVIRQVLPPVKEPHPTLDELSELDSIPEEREDEAVSTEHFDFGPVITKLPNLEEFHVTYQARNCGMNFQWNLFLFTLPDCRNLSRCLADCSALRFLHIHQSKVDDQRCEMLVNGIMDHPTLEHLDLSHNVIRNDGAKFIANLLDGHSKIKKLVLLNNSIKAKGGKAVANILPSNDTLEVLNLRLNKISSEGAKAMFLGLTKNQSIRALNVASNDIDNEAGDALLDMLIENKKLEVLNLSCNKLGAAGGRQLQQGMQSNTTLTEIDLRLTNSGPECEYFVSQVLKKNRDRIQEENYQPLNNRTI